MPRGAKRGQGHRGWPRAQGVGNVGSFPINLDLPLKPEKLYFKILQAVHHAAVVERFQQTGELPVGMSRQADKLTTFVKPSSPSEETREKVKLNTEQWMQTNMLILKTHYDEVIANGVERLPAFDQTAMEKAIAYGKVRYKHRLITTSITNFTDLIKTMSRVQLGEESTTNCLVSPGGEGEWPTLRHERGDSGHVGIIKSSLSVALSQDYAAKNPHVPAGSTAVPPFPGGPPTCSPGLNGGFSPVLTSVRSLGPRPNPPSCSVGGGGITDGTLDLVVGEEERSTLGRERGGSGRVGIMEGSLLEALSQSYTAKNPHTPAGSTLVSLPHNQSGCFPGPNRDSSLNSTPTQSPHPNPNQLPRRTPVPDYPSCSNLDPFRTPTPKPRRSLGPVSVQLGSDPGLFSGCDRPRGALPKPNMGGESALGGGHSPAFPIVNSGPQSSSPYPNLVGEGAPGLPDQNRPINRVIVAEIHGSGLEGQEQGDLTGCSLDEEGGETLFSNVAVPMSGRISDSPEGARDLGGAVGLMTGTVGVLGPQVNVENCRAGSPPPGGSLGSDSALESLKWGPIRHPSTPQKIKKWILKVDEPVVILGDSNLSRIPKHSYPSVQIDSFPGAQIHHLRGVLNKLNPCTKTQRVILSVGLNNCLRQNLMETMKKQLQQLMAMTRKNFPNAQIIYPQIHFSKQLPRTVQSLIEEMNGHIRKTYRTLNLLDDSLFKVHSHDPVHWTSETAKNILKTWMEQLN